MDVLPGIPFHCGIELEYHEDLRTVQRNLNEMPHVNRDSCVPVDAVRELFEAGQVTPSFATPH